MKTNSQTRGNTLRYKRFWKSFIVSMIYSRAFRRMSFLIFLTVIFTSVVPLALKGQQSMSENCKKLILNNNKVVDEGYKKQVMMAIDKLDFTENKGQLKDLNGNQIPDVLFTGKSNDVQYLLTKTGISYVYRKSLGHGKLAMTRVNMDMKGANKEPKIITVDAEKMVLNYFLSGSNEQENVHSFASVIYKEVYPFIDMKVYTKDNALEYDFIVHPGGDPAQIKLSFTGDDHLKLNKKGEMTITNKLGVLTQNAPYTYQASSKENTVIESKFRLKRNEVSFALGKYDNKNDLIIDPGQKWGTYFGGTNSDVINGIVCDASGNIYVVGTTMSTSGVASSSAFQTTYGGGSYDVFLAKFSNSGAGIWATYYGGSGDDIGYSIALDGSGYPWICGSTTSFGLPLKGAFQSSNGGGTGMDGFIASFNSSGTFEYGTYYGGSGDDEINTIYVTGSSTTTAIYVGGETSSSNNIATSGTYQTIFTAWGTTGFVAEFGITGSSISLAWGTYYGGTVPGGSPATEVFGLVPDGGSNIFIVGVTICSSTFATTGAYQTSFGGVSDAFVGDLDNLGNNIWTTYFGGSGVDGAFGILISGSSLIISGNTQSVGLGTTGVYQSSNAGGYDGYLLSMNNSGTGVNWCTYIGGSGDDIVSGGLGTDGTNYYLTGSTSGGLNLTAPGCAFQTTLSGGSGTDVFLAKFNSIGGGIFQTYIGGPRNEITGAENVLALDPSKNIFVAGSTTSTTGIASLGAYQYSNGGGTDGFIFGIDNCTLCQMFSNAPASSCTGTSLTLSNYAWMSYQWQVYSSSTSSYTNVSGTSGTSYTYTPGTAGQYQCSVTDPTTGCQYAWGPVMVNAVPVVTAGPSNTSICAGTGASFSVSATGTGLSYQWQENTGYAWSSAITATTAVSGVTSSTLSLSGLPVTTNGYQYRCVVSSACPSATSGAATLTVNPTPIPPVNLNPETLCVGIKAILEPYNVTASTYYVYGSSTTCPPPGSTNPNANGAPIASFSTSTWQDPTPVSNSSYAIFGSQPYFVVAENSSGCLGYYQNMSVPVYPAVQAPTGLTSNPNPSCPGISTTISASTSGISNYNWYNSSGTSLLGTGLTFSPAPTVTTNYLVESVSSATGGCLSSGVSFTQNVSTITLYQASSVTVGTVTYNSTGSTINFASCQPTEYPTLSLTGSSSTLTGNLLVSWYLGSTFLACQEVSSVSAASFTVGSAGDVPFDGAQYIVQVSTKCTGTGSSCSSYNCTGCLYEAIFTLHDKSPNVTISSNSPTNNFLCPGTSVILSGPSTPPQTYTWYQNGISVAGPSGTYNYTLSTIGDYYFTATTPGTPFTCPSQTIHIKTPPALVANAVPTVSISNDAQLFFTSYSHQISVYLNGNFQGYLSGTVYSATSNGYYSFTAIDPCSGKTVASNTIKVAPACSTYTGSGPASGGHNAYDYNTYATTAANFSASYGTTNYIEPIGGPYKDYYFGVKLEISGTGTVNISGANIIMGECTEIEVDPGATLVLDGVTITGCTQWKGIQVDGVQNYNKVGRLSGSFGTLNMMSSTISDALNAVYSQHGGTVQINGSVFVNNVNHIFFDAYNYNHNSAVNGQSTFGNLVTQIVTCSPLVTPSYVNNWHMVYMENVGGITFNVNNYFHASDCNQNSYGVEGCNLNVGTISTYTVDLDGNDFDGPFNAGISNIFYNTGTSGTSNGMQITGNTFGTRGISLHPISGILFNNADNCIVQGTNIFKNMINGMEFYQDISGGGPLGVTLSHNDFEYNTYGLVVAPDQYPITNMPGNLSPNSINLVTSCNKFIYNTIGFIGNGNLVDQGATSTDAGNNFNSTTTTNTCPCSSGLNTCADILWIGTNPFTNYYMHNLYSPYVNTALIPGCALSSVEINGFSQTASVNLNVIVNSGISTLSPCWNVFDPSPKITDLTYKLQLYPNPNNGNFTVGLSDVYDLTGYTIELWDILGRRLQSQLIVALPNVEVNATDLAAGAYTVRLIDPTGKAYSTHVSITK